MVVCFIFLDYPGQTAYIFLAAHKVRNRNSHYLEIRILKIPKPTHLLHHSLELLLLNPLALFFNGLHFAN